MPRRRVQILSLNPWNKTLDALKGVLLCPAYSRWPPPIQEYKQTSAYTAGGQGLTGCRGKMAQAGTLTTTATVKLRICS